MNTHRIVLKVHLAVVELVSWIPRSLDILQLRKDQINQSQTS